MKNLVLIVLVFCGLAPMVGQYSARDYQKADSIANHFSSLIYNQVNTVHSFGEGADFWYKTKTSDGQKYVYVDGKAGEKQVMFDGAKLAASLADILGEELKWTAVYLSHEKVIGQADTFMFQYKKRKYTYLPNANKLLDRGTVPASKKPGHWGKERDELACDPILSPDKSKTAYIREYNVYIKDKDSGKEIQVTFDGSPGEYYSSYLKWSPDAKYLAVNKYRTAEKRFITFMESAPKDQWQPKIKKVEYHKPGDALPIKQACLIDVEKMQQIAVDFSEYLHQFSLSDPKWRNDSRAFTLEYNQRGHQKYSVLEVNASDGAITVLAEENPETFFFYSGKKYRYDVNDGEEMIWMSERDGWNHLYLYNHRGDVKHQITQGDFVVRKVIHVDEKERRILFCASGVNEGEDPYHLHYYSIAFDGTGMKVLTPENANHKVTFSKDYNYLVDYYSRADMPGKTVLRKAKNGKVILELECTDITALQQTTWQQPEVFSAKGRDGETDIWGLIYRPSSFDPNLEYPVIEYIYAGPHDSFVPKSFIGVNRRFAALAELGFICVQIDGMGTSNRSKAFHDVCWKNLKDAGFPDRIAWMQAASKQYPYVDIDRVGIFGGSAGGQSSTGAVLFYPDFYDVAVSSCGCHDNRMDKIWWNEQWMGYPVEAHYDSCSNVLNAHKLQGDLMLILGEIDDNVDPASTVQVVDALIEADKEFEFVMLPGMNHTLGGAYGERKRRDFFVKHLLRNETPVWNK